MRALLPRIMLHAMWLAVPAAMLLFATVPDERMPSERWMLVLAALIPPALLVEVPVGLSLGLLAGIGVGMAARLTRNRIALTVVGASCSSLGLVMVALMSGRGWGIGAILPWICLPPALVGGVATLLAQRHAPTSETSSASNWGLGAVAFATLALWLGTYLLAALGDPNLVATCAAFTNPDQGERSWVSTSFPPQTWCLTSSQTISITPVWAFPALVGLLTGALICTWLAISQARALPKGSTLGVPAALALLGLVMAGMLWQPLPPDTAPRHPFVRYTPPTPIPTPTPSPTPPPTAEVAEDTLDELSDTALTARGTALLWPQHPTITQHACTVPSGAPGTTYLLNGRFTTRDMAEVHGADEMLQVSRANERIAKQLVDAWVATGLVTGADVMHGEWWMGPPAGTGVIGQAHVGFEQGVGVLQVSSGCATNG